MDEPICDDCGEYERDCECAHLRNRLAAAEAAQREAEHLLRNLLAVIHGDGGHYADEHGVEKASADAETKWYAQCDAEVRVGVLTEVRNAAERFYKSVRAKANIGATSPAWHQAHIEFLAASHGMSCALWPVDAALAPATQATDATNAQESRNE